GHGHRARAVAGELGRISRGCAGEMKPWYAFILTVARGILWVLASKRMVGREHVPRDRAFILASNHYSFFEPPVVATSCPREIHFLAKASLFRIPIFGALIRSVNSIPINRGSTDVTGLNAAVEVVRSGGNLLIFPEGGRNKTGKLKEAKGGIGYLV